MSDQPWYEELPRDSTRWVVIARHLFDQVLESEPIDADVRSRVSVVIDECRGAIQATCPGLLASPPVTCRPLDQVGYANHLLDDWKELLWLGWTTGESDGGNLDDFLAGMAGEPALDMANSWGGSIAGITREALGAYTLPLPHPGRAVPLCWTNIARAAEENDWAADDVLRVVATESIVVTELYRRGALASRAALRFTEYVAGIEVDENRLRDVWDDIGVLPQSPPGSTERDALLGAFQPTAAENTAARLSALVVRLASVSEAVTANALDALDRRDLEGLREVLANRRLTPPPIDAYIQAGWGLSLSDFRSDPVSAVAARRVLEAGDLHEVIDYIAGGS